MTFGSLPGFDQVRPSEKKAFLALLQRIIALESAGGGGGVTDHGALTGLADDDHPQYHNDARGDARYEALGAVAAHAGAADPHTGYQKESEKAAASGYASLDGSVKVPIAQIPTGTTGTTVPFGNDARFTDTRTPTDNTVSTIKIVNAAVDNTKLANMAASTFKGRVTASTGDPEDMTATQATSLLNTFTSLLKGLAPASGGGTVNFLRADGTWAAPGGGGGGSPGGLTTHVQYNNAGAFDGAANVLIDASEELVIPTKVAFTDRVMSSAPASAATDTVNFFDARVGRRNMASKDQYGMTTLYGGILGITHPMLWSPSTGTTVANVGLVPTNVGTVSTPAIGTTSMQASMRRWQSVSAATANAIAETYSTVANVFRGDASNRGGFFMSWTCNVGGTFAALQRGFWGLMNATGATATTQSPSAMLNCIGFGWDSSQTTLRLMHNDGAGACTTVDLGASFPSNDTVDMYDFFLYCPKVGTEVRWAVRRRSTDVWTEGVITTDLPSTTTTLTPHLWTNNGGTAAAATFACAGLSLEYVP